MGKNRFRHYCLFFEKPPGVPTYLSSFLDRYYRPFPDTFDTDDKPSNFNPIGKNLVQPQQTAPPSGKQ